MRIWFQTFDDPTARIDYVEVPEDASIKDLARHLEALRLDDVLHPGKYLSADNIDIWQLNKWTNIRINDRAHWLEVVRSCHGRLDKIATRVVDGGVARFKPPAFNDEYFTLVVVGRPPELVGQLQEDGFKSLTTLYPNRYYALLGYQNSRNTRTPSQTANPESFLESQGEDFPIYDGRHPEHKGPNLALPVNLYHPIFQTWCERAFDKTLMPPAMVTAFTAELMRRVSILYIDEDEYKPAIRGPLLDAIRHGVDTGVKNELVTTDGHVSVRLKLNGTIRKVPFIIDEQRQGSISFNADPSTQASFSMRQMWADCNLDEFRNLACCPTFLLGFSGCQLAICGAVLTEKYIVNRLATFWVGRNSIHDEESTIRISRALYALSLAINELSAWYKTLIASNAPPFTSSLITHPRFFPFVNSFPLNGEDFNAGVIEFEYLHPLQASHICTTFLVETRPVGSHTKTLIVVKFTQRYCPGVHRLLAAKGMAPKLLYCGPIDKSTLYDTSWQLVVMDFFDGRPSYENDRHKDSSVRQRVVKIVKTAHEEGFVLGDVRPPNVLVNADGEIKLIDFDWAGRQGEARYPAHMSTGLWVTGVEPMGVIEKKHDEQVVDRWFR